MHKTIWYGACILCSMLVQGASSTDIDKDGQTIVRLEDCFNKKQITVPGMQRGYRPVFFEKKYSDPYLYFSFLIGVFSGTDANILEKAASVAAGIYNAMSGREFGRLWQNPKKNKDILSKIRRELVKNRGITRAQVQLLFFNTYSVTSSRKYRSEIDRLVVPKEVQELMCEHEASYGSYDELEKSFKTLYERTAIVCRELAASHQAIVLIPDASKFRVYVERKLEIQ